MTPPLKHIHPRPFRQRDNWESLDGIWEFSQDRSRTGLTNRWYEGKRFERQINVPFTYQTQMSGIGDPSVEEVVWYARDFHIPAEWIADNRDILLHFGAVDYRSVVWINGTEVGHNEGGHVPFTFDIAPYVKPGENRIYLRVEDSLDPYQPRGKQSTTGVSRGVYYQNTTGIWQSVWMEPVSALRIENLATTARLADKPGEPDSIKIELYIHGPGYGYEAEVELCFNGEVVQQARTSTEHGKAIFDLEVPDAKRWSPDEPNLYDLRARLYDREELLDEVRGYSGFRRIDLKDGKFWLNDKPLLLKLVLDQGYWPESGMTAPNDDALRADVELCKQMGFNGARKHQKVEDPRWLYWCDKLGFLVWAEMANAIAWSMASEERLIAEWARVLRRDVSHPCIVAWVPLNESWGVPGLGVGHPGQYAFVERLVALTRRIDGTRPVIDNDGWEHTDVTDIFAIHDYTPTGAMLKARYAEVLAGGPMQLKSWGKRPVSYVATGARYRGQPVVLSEVGGFLSLTGDEDEAKLDPLYKVYGSVSGSDQLLNLYRDLMAAIAELPFVAGFCYTQLTDVEQEKNGLLTFDRKPKVDLTEIRKIHEEMDVTRERLREPLHDR